MFSQPLRFAQRSNDRVQAQAAQACQRISQNRNSLLPSLRDNTSIQPPFEISQITEHVVLHESYRLFVESTGQLRRKYFLGMDHRGNQIENWVTRWLLCHVISQRSTLLQGFQNKDAETVVSPGSSQIYGSASSRHKKFSGDVAV